MRRQFYREVEREEFFGRHLPRVLAEGSTAVRMTPYLSGDRTSFRQKSASYRGISLGATRDDLLRATAQAVVQEMRTATGTTRRTGGPPAASASPGAGRGRCWS